MKRNKNTSLINKIIKSIKINRWQDETAYLLSTEANRIRLYESIKQVEAGEVIKFEL